MFGRGRGGGGREGERCSNVPGYLGLSERVWFELNFGFGLGGARTVGDERLGAGTGLGAGGALEGGTLTTLDCVLKYLDTIGHTPPPRTPPLLFPGL